VADFHRLPEHPGDRNDRLRHGKMPQRIAMEAISLTALFIAG
jgi:hypothetical protein